MNNIERLQKLSGIKVTESTEVAVDRDSLLEAKARLLATIAEGGRFTFKVTSAKEELKKIEEALAALDAPVEEVVEPVAESVEPIIVENDDKEEDDKEEDDKEEDDKEEDDKEEDDKEEVCEEVAPVLEADEGPFVVAFIADGKIYGLEPKGLLDKSTSNLDDAYVYSDRKSAEEAAYRKNDSVPGAGAWYVIPLSAAQERMRPAVRESEESLEDVVARIMEKDLTPQEVEVDYQNGPTENSGIKKVQGTKIRLPANVKAAVTQRIRELEQAVDLYDDKGYNDKSVKQQAVDCLKQILDNLSTGDLEGVQKAQVYITTLMSPLTDFFPPQIINWLAHAGNPLIPKDAD